MEKKRQEQPSLIQPIPGVCGISHPVDTWKEFWSTPFFSRGNGLLKSLSKLATGMKGIVRDINGTQTCLTARSVHFSLYCVICERGKRPLGARA